MTDTDLESFKNVPADMYWKAAALAQIDTIQKAVGGLAFKHAATVRVVGSHRSKSIDLPVVLVTTVAGEFTLRDNFHDVNLMAMLKRPAVMCESGSCRVVSVTCPRCREVIAPDVTDRSPSARWVELFGNYYLAAGDVFARANPSGWWCVYRGRWTPAEWQRTSHHHRVIREGKTAPGIGAAMSGAEDALLAIAAEIVGAVGR